MKEKGMKSKTTDGSATHDGAWEKVIFSTTTQYAVADLHCIVTVCERATKRYGLICYGIGKNIYDI